MSPARLPRFALLFFSAWLFSAWLALTAALPARAQDTTDAKAARPDVDLSIGGTLQPRLSHGRFDPSGDGDDRDRTGFGIRRARLITTATLAERAGVSFQFGAAGTSAVLLDAELFYDATEALRLRAGRFTPAQPRAFQPTGHRDIDLVARAAIAQRWGGGTLANDGRDFGVEARYETDRATARFTLHNGDGSWDRALGNVRPDIVGDPTGGTDTRGIAASGYATWRPAALPGVEVGGYAGYNGARNQATIPPGGGSAAPPGAGRSETDTRPYASYSGHLYWGAEPGAQPVRLKADVIGTRYGAFSSGTGSNYDQHALGASLLGAVGLFDQSAELLARYERYDAFTGRSGTATDYLSAGASLSVSALRGRPYERLRVTGAYSTRMDDEHNPHLFVVQAQIVF